MEPEFAEVLPLFGTMSESVLEKELKSEILLSKIKACCATIRSAQSEEGLFIARQPLLAPFDPRLAQPGAFDSGLGQIVFTVTERCNPRFRNCPHGADLGWVRDHGADIPGVLRELSLYR